MAFQVDINRNIDDVEEKVIGGFTKRQVILFPIGAALGIGVYFLTKTVLPNDIAMILMIIVAMPFFLFASYKRDGQHLEEFIADIVKFKFKEPKVYTYETNNIYGYLEKMSYRKKVLKISDKDIARFDEEDTFKGKLLKIFKPQKGGKK